MESIKLKKGLFVLGVGSLYLGGIFAYSVNLGLKDPDLKKVVNEGNYIFVIGENAKPIDVVSAIDLASALSVLKEPKMKKVLLEMETETEKYGSEIVKLWRDNDKINLGEGFKVSVVDINEGKIEADRDYKYKVYLKMNEDAEAFKFTFDKPTNDRDPEFLGDISDSSENKPVVKLVIEFDDAVPFTNDRGEVNEDLVGEKIIINGKTFFFSSETEDDKLVLYRTAKKVLVEKGKPVTVKIGDNEYTIEITGFGQKNGNDKVILKINGDTDDVEEGHTKTIGGLTVYADSIWTEDDKTKGGAVLLVGGKKIILKDRSKVKVGEDEDSVDDTLVKIVNEGTEGKLDAVKEIDIYYWDSDSDTDYIDTEHSFDKDKEVFDVFRIKMLLNDFDTEKYTIDRSDKKIEFTEIGQFAEIDDSGNIVNINDDGGKTYFYEGAIATENDWIPVGTYKEVNGNKVVDETTTALLKVDNIDIDNENGKVTFKDVITGDEYETSKGKFNETGDTLKLTVKGEQYDVKLVDPTNKKIQIYHEGFVDNSGKLTTLLVFPTFKMKNLEFTPLVVKYNESGDNLYAPINTSLLNMSSLTIIKPTIGITVSVDTDKNELKIEGLSNFGTENKTIAGILIREPRLEGQSEDDRNLVLVAYDKDSDNKFHFDKIFILNENKALNGVDYESNDDLTGYVDKYGTLFKVNTDSDNGDTEILYPDEQVYGKFVVDLKGEESENTEMSIVELTSGRPKEVNEKVKTIKVKDVEFEKSQVILPLALLDTEVENNLPEGRLIISIGGPCVNEVTKYFLEGTKYASCEGWPLSEGQYLIEYAKKDNKVALIIAGTTGEDTRKAVRDFIEGKVETQENNTSEE